MNTQEIQCIAKKGLSEDPCGKKRKAGHEYCSGHLKSENKDELKLEVWAENIRGIIYYIDRTGNVYLTEDIIRNSTTPRIIAKYKKENSITSIPEFNI